MNIRNMVLRYRAIKQDDSFELETLLFVESESGWHKVEADSRAGRTLESLEKMWYAYELPEDAVRNLVASMQHQIAKKQSNVKALNDVLEGLS